LSVFSGKDTDGNPINIVQTQADHILGIATWVSEKAKSGEITLDRNSFESILTSEAPGIQAGAEFGDLIESDGAIAPEYLDWIYLGVRYKIWFSDEAFRVQYDEYEHEVVQPIEVLNDLQRPYSAISELIETDISKLIHKANEITANAPYTTLSPTVVEWIDKDTGSIVNITWLVAVYGPMGNNPVSIGEALKKHILANSSFNAIEWHNVMPKLFRPTEFIMIPGWSNYSVDPTMAVSGIYRPIVSYSDMMYLANTFTTSYEQPHLEANLSCMSHIYKSLGILAIGNEGNNDQIYKIEEKFPDYNLVSNTSLDFNRLSPRTQEWVGIIHEMLLIAETMNETTPLEAKFSRLKRGGITYLVSSYEGVSYLVLTKESYTDLYLEPGDRV
jgi:hypothetical protein